MSSSLNSTVPSNGKGEDMATATTESRIRHMHMLFTEDEMYRLRMVASDSGVKMANLVREILHAEIERRFVEMSRRLGSKK
jgi:hypothetical protein